MFQPVTWILSQSATGEGAVLQERLHLVLVFQLLFSFFFPASLATPHDRSV
jgi:hypothetical protein